MRAAALSGASLLSCVALLLGTARPFPEARPAARAVPSPGGAEVAVRTPPVPGSPGPSAPGRAQIEGLTLWLRGPFGTVAGSAADVLGERGAGDEPLPLDAVVRQAPLHLEADRPARSLAAWVVTAQEVRPSGSRVILAANSGGGHHAPGLRFSGPDRPGIHRIEASVTAADGLRAQAWWLLDVPDREPPADGLLDVPAPSLRIQAASGAATGWPGSGCYIYLCVDVGRLPPAATLETLSVRPGEMLHATLSDGSAVRSWRVTALPLGHARRVGSSAGQPAEATTAFSLEAPPAGAWLMVVEVTYDRERGWAQAIFRIRSRGSREASHPSPAPSGP